MRMLVFLSLLPSLCQGTPLYRSCVQCHGQRGEGSVKERSPRLGGQHAWYLEIALRDFRKGARKHPKIKRISDSDITELAAYIRDLK